MEVILVLLPIALFLGLGAIATFIYITMKGQYDDLETPHLRMLIEEMDRSQKRKLEKGKKYESN